MLVRTALSQNTHAIKYIMATNMPVMSTTVYLVLIAAVEDTIVYQQICTLEMNK